MSTSWGAYLALHVVADVRDDHRGLGRELNCHALQDLLVLGHQEHMGSLVQIPVTQSLSYSRRGPCYHDLFTEEVVG